MSYMNKIMASCKPAGIKKARGQKLDESKIDASEEALARRNAILDKVDAADGKTSRPNSDGIKKYGGNSDPSATKFTKEGLAKLPSGIGGKFGAIVDEKKKEAGLLQRKGKKKKGKGLKSACWKGYEAIGMKTKNGRKVPNCVPKK